MVGHTCIVLGKSEGAVRLNIVCPTEVPGAKRKRLSNKAFARTNVPSTLRQCVISAADSQPRNARALSAGDEGAGGASCYCVGR